MRVRESLAPFSRPTVPVYQEKYRAFFAPRLLLIAQSVDSPVITDAWSKTAGFEKTGGTGAAVLLFPVFPGAGPKLFHVKHCRSRTTRYWQPPCQRDAAD
jgi:hypothetical protein